MEHARQWFVDLSRFMMGGSEAGCEQGESGRRWEAGGPASHAGFLEAGSLWMGGSQHSLVVV